jgi:hypothetical protein
VTLLSQLLHPGNGTKIDEIATFVIPLVVLVVLYVWSSRKPKEKGK